ncbi:MAG: photosynthetic complex assembly protein 2 [Betaproteobacteria bacterium HGW-Betaproteobacteria-3]|jgi:putative photosynthetic complex assembly protein 2|nr:MAG: photosynthetic complex assembly protein 2 [Betaproteobacteria bacterium HGW-Betaproteobacteria-3]
MALHVLPVLFTLLVWWFSTGAILYLNGLPNRTFKWTMGLASVMLALALWGLSVSSLQISIGSAYCAFLCAVLVWAWQEIAFLLGYVTGPRRVPCTPGATGWKRTSEAIQAVLHHELALIGLAIAVAAVSWDAPNQTGLWTFGILWAMRTSAKLNIFLGVRNLAESFLPDHLRYMETYFRRAPMNALFPFSVILSSAVAIPMWMTAIAPTTSEFQAVQLSLIGAMLVLAIVEHGFMVVPLAPEALWKWGLSSRK